MGSTPQYQWRNRIATVNQAQSTGDLFLPLPSLERTGIPRGGLDPRITDVEGGGGTVNAGPCELNTNYHAKLSTLKPFGNTIREGRDLNIKQKAGALGRIRR